MIEIRMNINLKRDGCLSLEIFFSFIAKNHEKYFSLSLPYPYPNLCGRVLPIREEKRGKVNLQYTSPSLALSLNLARSLSRSPALSLSLALSSRSLSLTSYDNLSVCHILAK